MLPPGPARGSRPGTPGQQPRESVHLPPAAPVAQLDRASGFEPEGREFESLRARYFLCSLSSTPPVDTLSLFELKSRSCPNEIKQAFTYAVGRVRGLSFRGKVTGTMFW